MHPVVKEYDNRILLDERDQIMSRPPADWNIPGQPLGIQIEGWEPQQAYEEFMSEYDTP